MRNSKGYVLIVLLVVLGVCTLLIANAYENLKVHLVIVTAHQNRIAKEEKIFNLIWKELKQNPKQIVFDDLLCKRISFSNNNFKLSCLSNKSLRLTLYVTTYQDQAKIYGLWYGS